MIQDAAGEVGVVGAEGGLAVPEGVEGGFPVRDGVEGGCTAQDESLNGTWMICFLGCILIMLIELKLTLYLDKLRSELETN